jgi:hypothetical protein
VQLLAGLFQRVGARRAGKESGHRQRRLARGGTVHAGGGDAVALQYHRQPGFCLLCFPKKTHAMGGGIS